VGLVLASVSCSSAEWLREVVVLEVDVPAELGRWQPDTDPESDRCRFGDFETYGFTAQVGDRNVLPQDEQIAGEWRRSRPMSSVTGRVVDGRCRTSIDTEVTTADPIEVTISRDGAAVDTIWTRSITWKEVGGSESDRSPGSPWIVDP
jgi:hypothetical protein